MPPRRSDSARRSPSIPPFGEARYNLAIALDDAGRPHEAAAELESLLGLDRFYADAYFNLADLYQAPGPACRRGAPVAGVPEAGAAGGMGGEEPAHGCSSCRHFVVHGFSPALRGYRAACTSMRSTTHLPRASKPVPLHSNRQPRSSQSGRRADFAQAKYHVPCLPPRKNPPSRDLSALCPLRRCP